MREFLKISILCLIAFSTVRSSVATANAQAKNLPTMTTPLTLGDVDGETFDQMTVINIRFNEKLSWTQPPVIEDHGMFLQITLPDTLVNEPGKFFNGAVPHLPKIAIIQSTYKDAAVRIFTNRPASAVRQASTTEILGNRLIMTLDHKKLEALLGDSASNTNNTADTIFVGPPEPTTKTAVSAESVIASTTPRSDLVAPSLILKKEGTSGISGSGLNIDLRGKLTKVAIFSGILFLLLIASWLAKPYLRRKKTSEKGGLPAPLAFETIATMALNPRQKLMVVQIGNDRVLLGVGADSINFLTNLTTNEQTEKPFAAPSAKMISPMGSRNFEESLADNPPFEMFERPVLKNIEGNDPASLAAPAVQTDRRRREPLVQEPIRNKSKIADRLPSEDIIRERQATAPGSRLNIRIDDNGASRVAVKSSPKKVPEPKKQAIDDITSIIREKLNSLRAI